MNEPPDFQEIDDKIFENQTKAKAPPAKKESSNTLVRSSNPIAGMNFGGLLNLDSKKPGLGGLFEPKEEKKQESNKKEKKEDLKIDLSSSA